ncbi:MAG TPA: hypothetical protein HPP83_06705, partial [Candidatus Hydrogenedentes bacterium]|nr:hypothetical protein [Candidatus Hydrogenedentota bacterium]
MARSVARRSERPRSSLIRLVEYVWRFKTTGAGKSVLGGLLLAAALGSYELDVPVFRLFGVVGALWGVAFLAGHLRRARVAIAGAFPERASAGQTVAAVYTLSNAARGTIYDVSLGLFGLPPSLEQVDVDVVPSLTSGESASTTLALHPLKRGVYTLPPLKAYTTFP